MPYALYLSACEQRVVDEGSRVGEELEAAGMLSYYSKIACLLPEAHFPYCCLKPFPYAPYALVPASRESSTRDLA